MLDLLSATDAPTTAGELRRRLPENGGADLDLLRTFAEGLGGVLDATWSEGDGDGLCDLLFRRADLPPEVRCAVGLARPPAAPRPWKEWANDPARFAVARRLVPEVRAHVRRTLPASMLPSSIEVLDALPTTGSGKIDHRALPAPRGLHLMAEETFAEPRSDEERTLSAIWSDVLRLDRVGIRDDVFELGGDSLTIFQITTRASRSGIPLTPRDVFQHRTIAALSDALGKRRAGAASSEPAPLVAASRDAHRVNRAELLRGGPGGRSA